MSESSEPTSQEIVSTLQTLLVENYISIAFAALPVYEYLITLDQEIDLVWRRKTRFSIPSILLVSTRVCMVISAITALITLQNFNSCISARAVDILAEIMDTAGSIQIALFSALRVSALYNRSSALFIIVMMLGLVPVGTNIFKDIRLTYVQQAGTCIEGIRISDTLARKFVFVTRIPVIVTDLLVLILTWAKTYKQLLRSRGIGISTHLSTCLSRDGTMYFLALLLLNILQIATHKSHLTAPVSFIVPVLPPILINRFMLNLQQAGNTSDTMDQGRSTVSTLRFQLSEQTIGSMGAPLDHEGVAAQDEREDGEYAEEDIELDCHRCNDFERRGSPERSMAGGLAVMLV